MTTHYAANHDWRDDEAFARQLDASDPLASYRDKFHIPKAADGRDVVYFAGNSLGLQPRATRDLVNQELDDWATQAVEAHFHGKTPWYSSRGLSRGWRWLVGGCPAKS
jgi:kynureninase